MLFEITFYLFMHVCHSTSRCWLTPNKAINLNNPFATSKCGTKSSNNARCPTGQCCSKNGFCGPVYDGKGYINFNNGGYYNTTNQAFEEYCTNGNEGDWRKCSFKYNNENVCINNIQHSSTNINGKYVPLKDTSNNFRGPIYINKQLNLYLYPWFYPNTSYYSYIWVIGTDFKKNEGLWYCQISNNGKDYKTYIFNINDCIIHKLYFSFNKEYNQFIQEMNNKNIIQICSKTNSPTVTPTKSPNITQLTTTKVQQTILHEFKSIRDAHKSLMNYYRINFYYLVSLLSLLSINCNKQIGNKIMQIWDLNQHLIVKCSVDTPPVLRKKKDINELNEYSNDDSEGKEKQFIYHL